MSKEWSVPHGGVSKWSARLVQGGDATVHKQVGAPGEMTVKSRRGQILMGFVCHPYKDPVRCLGIASFN